MTATVRLSYILLFLLYLGIGISCSSQEKTTDAPEDEVVENTAFFTANPQAIPEQEVSTLEIGEKAPDFKLPGTDGKFYQLADFDKAKVLVIIFSCNHCPTAQAYEERMIQISADYKAQGVELVVISPNSINGILPEELGYSDMGDSFEEMVIRAKDMNYNFPYLYDGDTHEASIKYGPVATPHAYVFDEDRKLTYVGRMDASEKPGTGNSEDLRAAIDATLAGKTPELNKTKTFGCSVKWAWKNKYAIKMNKEWKEKPVSLEDIDEAGLKNLLKNDSDKLRLINLWATWCGPCVIEYPEFVTMHRMFSGRDFEFISVSADKMKSKDRALAFLQKKSSALKNYIFSNEDTYALIEAIDPEWNGALPYTVLVEPGGKVVYRQMGTIEPQELRTAIVEHPMIGRYY